MSIQSRNSLSETKVTEDTIRLVKVFSKAIISTTILMNYSILVLLTQSGTPVIIIWRLGGCVAQQLLPAASVLISILFSQP